MIDGINDTPADADRPGRPAARRPVPREPHPDEPGRPHALAGQPDAPDRGVRGAPPRTTGIAVTIRRNRGQEIGAACGQLAAERAGEPAPRVVARRRELLVRESAAALRAVGGLTRWGPAGRGSRRASSTPTCRTSALAVRRVEKAGADRVHLDVMDGHFVPEPDVRAGRRSRHLRPRTELPFDAHLMISEPGRYIDEFIDAGCDSITFHVEIDEPIEPTLRRIRAAGRAAGLAIKPGTPVRALAKYRELLDIVLVMTVEPGFGGQSFMPTAARKIVGARDLLSYLPLGGEVHVDGGINRETAEYVGGLGRRHPRRRLGPLPQGPRHGPRDPAGQGPGRRGLRVPAATRASRRSRATSGGASPACRSTSARSCGRRSRPAASR